jgi:predicted dehydrogenase
VRIAIIGLGWAARAFNLPALRALDGAQLVGGYDGAQPQRASWERETGVPAFASLEALFERTAPEVVVVATPPQSHAELCVQALEAGAHVICEKPFVMDLDEADRVLAAAGAAARHVAVNHEFREKPIFRALLDRIGSPEAGRLAFAQIWQLMDLAPWDEPVLWRAAMPNRTLFEGGVHLVDLMLQVFGERPDGVYARHSSGLETERRADAVHLVTLDFPGGRLGQITIDRLCPAGTRYVEVRADCERASLRASEGGRAVLQVGRKRAERTGARVDFGPGGLAWMEVGLKRTTLARNPRNPGADGTTRLYRRIAAALARGEEPPASAREARDVLAVVEAAYRSAGTGRREEPAYSTAATL